MENEKLPHQHKIYLGMGTNCGDRLKNLMAAIDALAPEINVTRRSPIYQTPPWGYTDQPDFLNLVVEGETDLAPKTLLTKLKNLEKKVGRTATFRWGPREIDIDILFYDNLILSSDGLEIPHPRLHERAFVLVPLSDLTPNLIHPKLGKSISELLAEIDTSGITLYQPGHPTQKEAE
jgi:2-amino-4-hydroxy-6-hydroxymethyldihydropteridine diphosphokinase